MRVSDNQRLDPSSEDFLETSPLGTLGLELNELIREALELMLEKVNEEMASAEVELKRIAKRFGLRDWKELDQLFNEEGLDNPEIDLLYPEYFYLKDKLERLRKRKEELLKLLGGDRA